MAIMTEKEKKKKKLDSAVKKGPAKSNIADEYRPPTNVADEYNDRDAMIRDFDNPGPQATTSGSMNRSPAPAGSVADEYDAANRANMIADFDKGAKPAPAAPIPSMGEDQAVKELAPQLSHMGNDDQARMLAKAYMRGDEAGSMMGDTPSQPYTAGGQKRTDLGQVPGGAMRAEEGSSAGNVYTRGGEVLTRDDYDNMKAGQKNYTLADIDKSQWNKDHQGGDQGQQTRSSTPTQQTAQVDPANGYSGYSYNKDTAPQEFQDGKYTLDNGLEVTFGAEGEDRLTQEQRRAVMRKPTRGTRRMSGLSSSEPQGARRFAPPQQQIEVPELNTFTDVMRYKAQMAQQRLNNDTMDSQASRQSARADQSLARAELDQERDLTYDELQNKISVQNLKNRGTLGAVGLRNKGDMGVAGVRNKGTLEAVERRNQGAMSREEFKQGRKDTRATLKAQQEAQQNRQELTQPQYIAPEYNDDNEIIPGSGQWNFPPGYKPPGLEGFNMDDSDSITPEHRQIIKQMANSKDPGTRQFIQQYLGVTGQ